MRRIAGVMLGIVVLVGPVRAEKPQAKVIEDVWEIAQMKGVRVGYFRTTVEEIPQGSDTVLRTTKQMTLTLKRDRAVAKLQVEWGTEETSQGEVTAVFLRQHLQQREMVFRGTVQKDGLHVSIDGKPQEEVRRWDPQVLGLYRQERFFKDHPLKPGNTFSYVSYEPVINSVMTVRGKVCPEEEVVTLTGRKRLMRVEATPDKVEVPGVSVQFPGTVVWLDKERMPVRQQLELTGVGLVISNRTTREAALAQGSDVANLPNVLQTTLIPLNRAIPMPHGLRTRAVVYRITVKGDPDASTAFAQDLRQSVRNPEGNTFELHVQAIRNPQKVQDPNAEAGEEYLKSCYYLKSDDPRVVRYAKEAIGEETDPLLQARRIERWVHDHMRLDKSIAFAPADEICRIMAGDCRQYGMLTAALCRAVGIPSRTALGLVYAVDSQHGPIMALHVWTEVWVRGQWFAVDATLGQGSIGAAHIKISDHSWAGIHDLKPLLPLQRILGKVAIEVVSVRTGE